MSKPEQTFKLGSAQASIFQNDGEQGSFHTVTIQRRYKDGDEWKSLNSFTATQLANAIAISQRALAYILDQESSHTAE
jgi:hypothetical protein